MQQPVTFKARLILTGEGSFLANGYVSLDSDKTLAVGPEPPAGIVVRDLGNQIVFPRLINAHTHLEFSSLAAPFGAQTGFPGWVREVIKWRQLREEQRPVKGHLEAIESGMEESWNAGSGLLGEIASTPWPVDAYRKCGKVQLFLEQLGVLPGQAEERLRLLSERLAALADRGPGWELGLSPHAPYSLSEALFSGILQIAREQSLPVAMHLAETREEVDWLAGAGNGFQILQEKLGVPAHQQWRPKVGWILEQLTLAPRALVVHGNFLEPTHWESLAANRDKMSLVHCPRTHLHFRHPPFPLVEILRAGVRVAVGTDSRASNPDLSLLEELRTLRQAFPELEPAEIFSLGTSAGAEALGFQGRFGVIRAGASPELLTVAGPDAELHDPYAWLLDHRIAPKPLSVRS